MGFRTKFSVRFNLRHRTPGEPAHVLAICRSNVWHREAVERRNRGEAAPPEAYKHATKIYVNPSNWAEDGGLVSLDKVQHDPQAVKEAQETNDKLRAIAKRLNDLFFDYLKEHKRAPSQASFKAMAKQEATAPSSRPSTWSAHIDREIDGIFKRKGSKKSRNPEGMAIIHRQTRTLLENYGKKHGKLEFDTINDELYDKLIDFMRNDPFGNGPVSDHTVNKHLQVVRYWIRRAVEKKAPVYGFTASNWKKVKVETDEIALTEQEVDAIEALDLSKRPRLELSRDIFLLGVALAQRWSDLVTLTAEQVDDEVITLPRQQKTYKTAMVPRTARFDRLWAKYGGPPPFPKDPSSFNRNVKKICAMVPAMQRMELVRGNGNKRDKQGNPIDELVPRWERVHPHTMRRTGATLMAFDYGWPMLLVQRILGHGSLAQTETYLKPTNEQIRQLARNARGGNNAVLNDPRE